ncbi:MAG: DNA polymerase III subunit delta [Gemmatimonadota bacterium]|nr:DNA polymerase III subunit delta [Gemmatimonadota bacterium]MDE3172045.1 DNA polymerase III subunit delta [Gemmatimonadota bacterium]
MTKAADQKVFREALRSGHFDPVYYIHGDEEQLKDEAVRQLLGVAVDPATQAFNLDQRKGGDLDAEALGTMLATPPMMADRRVVVVRDVESLRKDARGLLDRYLRHPSPDMVLVLVAGPGAKPDRALTGATTAVEYAPLTGSQLPKWIVQRAERAGSTIGAQAASLLEEIAGGELAPLALEIEKLASYVHGGEITEEAVSAVVGVRREETMGHLLDAVGARDATAALAALPHVLQQPKSSAVTIVMALAVQTLAMAWGQASGLPPGRLAKEYYALLKESGSAYTGRAWGEAVASWTKAAPAWSARELDDALAALASTDAALKESRVSSDEQIMATLILTMCRGSTSRRAA